MLQSMGLQRVIYNLATEHHHHHQDAHVAFRETLKPTPRLGLPGLLRTPADADHFWMQCGWITKGHSPVDSKKMG